eukprot:885991-Pyramimonas_sp.AAC.1
MNTQPDTETHIQTENRTQAYIHTEILTADSLERARPSPSPRSSTRPEDRARARAKTQPALA